MSKKIDGILQSAVDAGDVPFVVAMAANASSVVYSGAFGPASQGRVAQENTVFRIFSMTKSVGSVAAMVLIDRGALSMDTPVADILPEWNDLRVLEGWDGNTPMLRTPEVAATVRHLATHTSGLEYEFWNTDMAKFLEVTEATPILSGLKAGLKYPLMTDPGTRWGYGPSIDWLGQIVEKVDGRRIDAFCQAEIFDPLGMSSTAFESDGMEDRLADVSIRDENGSFGPFEIAPPAKPEVYGMGHALYSTAPDYLTFLRMVLNKGALNGNRILSEGAVAQMTADQMQGLTFQDMVTAAPPLTADVAMPEGTTHSFAFVRAEADVPHARRAGSQSWAGVCNTHYWIDSTSELAAVIMTQSLPFVEEPYMRTYRAYEEGLYAMA
ncbi:serine hydrolase domain-containing protein [uncultured Roseobacter sp.]|uniref:serine hydrolase domain-containing protein n=1 Tax=uncultured Roseobacter sp. TaxID=114847 RepID=UPI002602B06F|nr:serine hydrolase domain-containing protein [uncultured Roseobacter sp.]